jgi:hypothetical protein
MAHNFNTIEGTEVFNVNDAVQGSHALTLDDVKNFVTGTLSDTLHSNETQAVPYTGVELPVTSGVTIGDTNTTQFSDGAVVDYTWDGTVWVVDIVNESLCKTVQHENICTTYQDKLLVKKSDGSCVTRNIYSLFGKQVSPTGNYTILPDDEVIYAQGGSTITLPNCSGNCNEKTIYRDACSDGLVTVLPPSGQTIDGVHQSRILQVGRGAFTYGSVVVI